MPLPNVTDTITQLLEEFRAKRDSEIDALSFVLPQYVTDHNDTAAYRNIDKQVNQLAKGLDRMIALLEKTAIQSAKIEGSVENFYGE